jgi:hypothetical protein
MVGGTSGGSAWGNEKGKTPRPGHRANKVGIATIFNGSSQILSVEMKQKLF